MREREWNLFLIPKTGKDRLIASASTQAEIWREARFLRRNVYPKAELQIAPKFPRSPSEIEEVPGVDGPWPRFRAA